MNQKGPNYNSAFKATDYLKCFFSVYTKFNVVCTICQNLKKIGKMYLHAKRVKIRSLLDERSHGFVTTMMIWVYVQLMNVSI